MVKNGLRVRRKAAPGGTSSSSLAVRNRVTKRVRRRKATKSGHVGMDKSAQDYVKLLTNPCEAPLAKVPTTGNTGFIFRAETDFLIGFGATETAGFVAWTPSGLAADLTAVPGPNVTGLLTAFGPNDSAVLTPGWNVNVPALSYLRANASNYRCVAACMQVFWPGSEVNRQGIISMVNTPMNTIKGDFGGTSPAITTTAANIRSSSQVVSRVPTDRLELVWRPGDLDYSFADPNSNYAGDGKGQMIISWAGIPVSTGLRFRLVAVWEWTPRPLNGLVPSLQSSSESSWSPGEIRAWLDKHVPGWTYHIDPTQRGSMMATIMNLAGIVAYRQARIGLNQMRG